MGIAEVAAILSACLGAMNLFMLTTLHQRISALEGWVMSHKETV